MHFLLTLREGRKKCLTKTTSVKNLEYHSSIYLFSNRQRCSDSKHFNTTPKYLTRERMSGFICNTLNLSKPSPTLASEFCHLWHHNGKRGKIKRYWQSLVELTCEICVNNIKQVFFGAGVGVGSLYPSASWEGVTGHPTLHTSKSDKDGSRDAGNFICWEVVWCYFWERALFFKNKVNMN